MSLRSTLLTALALAPLAAFATTGCAATTTSTGDSLGSSQDLLVADSESDDEDQQSEDAADDALSGASADADLEEGPNPSTDTPDAIAEKVRTNPGKFFQPAGCITTTVDNSSGSRVATHVFNACIGPQGKHRFTGTVVATWSKPGDGKLQVVREAKGFQIERIADGVIRTVDRTVTVVFQKNGDVYSKNRVVKMSGTSSTGKSFSRDANWNISFDASTKCVTRSGTATTIFEGRELTRTLDNVKRCGGGPLGCPDSGSITIERKKGQGDAATDITLVIEFNGGRDITVTGAAGLKKKRSMNWCRMKG